MPNIEEHIRKAMEEGNFEELPGKGKPLHLEENPLENPEWRLAHHIIRNSGFSLPWIELRKEIDADIDQARRSFTLAWNWRKKALESSWPANQVDADWQRALGVFREQIMRINKRIAEYNLQVPSDRIQHIKLNPEHEIEAIISQ